MGENLATILEFLRKHHFVKAEAALREELAHRQKGNSMTDEADQNLILKLRSMEDAVDTTGNPSFLSLPVAGRVSSEAQTGKPSATSISFNSESQRKPIKPAETVLGESNGLFSLYSHSLEGEGRGGSGSRQSNSEAEEPLEFWTIKEIQAAELPAEESESNTVLHDDSEEGRRRKAQLSKDYSNAMAKPHWDDAFEEEEEEEDDDSSLLRFHSSDAGFHSKKLLPPFRNGAPPPLPDRLLERVASTSGENAIRDIIVGLVEEEVWQNGKRKGVPLKTLLPPLPFCLPLESSEGLAYTAQEGIRVAPNINQSRADNPALVSISAPSTEGLPRLPPVKLHTPEKKGGPGGLHEVEGLAVGTSTRSLEPDAFQSFGSITPPPPEGDFRLGTLLDIPFSQELSSSGAKRLVARPSVSQGITEEASKRLTGFASAPNDMGKDFPDEYWDSDTYEDDDDPGYIRQPIEDEAWFLANEIDYPSDDERSRNRAENNHNLYAEYGNLEDENNSLVEEESFFSGEEYYRSKGSDLQKQDRAQLAYENMYSRNSDCDDDAALRLRDAECFDLGRPEASWSGFVGQSSATGSQIKEVIYDDECQGGEIDAEDDDRHGSTRSGGFGVNSDAAEMGSEVRENILWGSSEGDLDQEFIIRESDYMTRIGPRGGYHNTFTERGDSFAESESVTAKGFVDEREDPAMSSSYRDEIGGQRRPGRDKRVLETETLGQDRRDSDAADQLVVAGNRVREGDTIGGISLGGFSFLPSNTGDVIASREESGKSLWTARDSGDQDDDTDDYGKSRFGPDDTLAAWKRKSNDSSPIVSTMDENLLRTNSLKHPAVSTHSADVLSGMQEGNLSLDGQHASSNRQGAEMIAPEDEDAIAEQEQIRRMGMEEDEYEVFDLRIIHRKNRTGFEEEKDLPVVLNSIIAGRYHATEYLGSAAFSKAIQAHDVHTGMDVCMKIIKNNKDFFDQSLDEIKLLKYVNKHDPADKHHILRLYDYFYHREHLFIVCELLRANLYEFQKFNRESGGEVYFTMPRLQSIARQCLEALEFLHGLGLIHCDLKPENILVKSYSRCEIKVIDLGSSCFQTDHLCSYVQSRSYRAPEVILGLPYDQKIDIWSLGCILAELCSGNVLFQNDSIATLLARVVGILGPADPEMLAKGKDSHKYFTKNHMLYERNQENDRLEYLLPKKTSLSHRLPMGDKDFVAFVGSLLQANPNKRPTASEALNHQWLSFPYEPISS